MLQGAHSTADGVAGEALPPHLELLRLYDELRSNAPTANNNTTAMQQSQREVERSSFGQMPPLGPDGNEIRTQVQQQQRTAQNPFALGQQVVAPCQPRARSRSRSPVPGASETRQNGNSTGNQSTRHTNRGSGPSRTDPGRYLETTNLFGSIQRVINMASLNFFWTQS